MIFLVAVAASSSRICVVSGNGSFGSAVRPGRNLTLPPRNAVKPERRLAAGFRCFLVHRSVQIPATSKAGCKPPPRLICFPFGEKVMATRR